MSRIHPTAVIDAGAVLGDGVEVGPWCVVGPGVSLAEDVRLVSHVVVQQDTSIGARTIVGDDLGGADLRSAEITAGLRGAF